MTERVEAVRGSGCTLAVLAKAPVPGYAKTRLIPRLGAEGAAELHAILLQRTVRTGLASGFRSMTLWCAPSRDAPFFRALPGGGALGLQDQPSGDLGARMAAAIEHHLALGGPVVLMGTDSPQISPEHLGRLRMALAGGTDVVVLPALDGGYAAIGVRRLDRRLFTGIPWGGPGVLAATLERVRELGWSSFELDPVRDVDLPEDVDWLLASGLLTREEQSRLSPRIR